MKPLTIIVLLLFLISCSSPPATDSNQPPSEQPPTIQASQPEPTAAATPEPTLSIAPQDPTSTPSDNAGSEADSSIQDQPAQADTNIAEYGVIATFHWLGLTTPTDITYNYEGWFNVLQNDSLQMVDEPKGYAQGDAGLNLDNECIESVPVEIRYNFTISGERLAIPLSDVQPEILMQYPDLVSGEQFQMFDLKFEAPDITRIDIPPFVNCMPDADQEFINSLGTYWINVIPFLSPEYRLVPAAEGDLCPGVLSFNEEGLGSLEVCYNIFLP
ncbi:MAG: hypothetical protein JSV42_02425 [Chloroflexota bacterium]|nr:MAG: hypothetical protein JSV42_02425 [Chloroflexota bacterium]